MLSVMNLYIQAGEPPTNIPAGGDNRRCLHGSVRAAGDKRQQPRGTSGQHGTQIARGSKEFPVSVEYCLCNQT